MNNIQNYSSVNVNSNYGKVNKSPNFKAFIKTEAAEKYLEKGMDILNKKPAHWMQASQQHFIIERLEQIKKIKPFAETTKFFDFVLDYNEGNGLFFGIKRCWQDISEIIGQYNWVKAINNEIRTMGSDTYIATMKDQAQAVDFENRLRGVGNSENFIDFFKAIEENAQVRVKEATETLKELLGKDVTKI